jgi:hypothetical protein
MKTNLLKVVNACVFVFLMTASTFGQIHEKEVRHLTKNPVKIEKVNVPIVVTETYFKEYPETTNEFWYGHPGYSANDWYGYYPYFYENEHPAYYIVEFTKGDNPYKAVYTREGVKVATHAGLHTPLPSAVTTAINKSAYKSWKIDNHKEEIFKSSENDVLKVYRIVIGKGKGIHTLYYRGDGTLLKDVKHKA